jgi:hypothetical protein
MRLQLVLFLMILAMGSAAQIANLDSIQLMKSIQVQETKFQEFVNTNAPLYNGTAYTKYGNKVIGHPYFKSDQFLSSNITYQDFIYRNIPMKYDLKKGLLVILNASKDFEMALLNDPISEFKIGEHIFIKIKDDSIHSYNPGTGFYELLYRGNSPVIVKYYKRIEASLKAEENTSRFVEYAFYYVFANKEYHEVDGVSDFFNLHKNQRGQLKKYMNTEKLHYSKEPAKTLVSLAAYYDTLSNE